MIRRQHVVGNFFDEAETLREVLDISFSDTYKNKISWQYFCDPRMYTYLRTAPHRVFPKEVYARFIQRLRVWCIENLGLAPMNHPHLHLMVNGCRLGLHSDFHNGAWGYVYSLTRWETRRFTGGETLLLRDGIPSYKKHHVHGEVLYELIPAQFNQLLVFDDRIVHATPTIEGTMDPLDGRIALVGHIRAAPPTVVSGSLDEGDARRVVLEAMPGLRDEIARFREVQGTIAFRLEVAKSGMVESITILTDNVVTPLSGYARSDEVEAVKSIVQRSMLALRFPATTDRSCLIVSVLIPLPNLQPIGFSVVHDRTAGQIQNCIIQHLENDNRLELNGTWHGDSFVVSSPIAGSIRIEPERVVFAFDPPMWVPSQRESFQQAMSELLT